MNITTDTLRAQIPLLSNVPDIELKGLLPHFKSMNVKRGQFLNTNTYVYFPVTARLGIHELEQDDRRIEITSVCFGESTTIVQYLHDHDMRTNARVIKEGLVFQFPVTQWKLLIERPQLFANIENTNRVLMSRVLKTFTCSIGHNLLQKTAQYFLSQNETKFEISQQIVSEALGCRRESATETFQELVKERAIYHSRGHVTIIDRKRLTELSCGCEKYMLPRS